MKRQTILEKLGDFVLGKGFYIVLFLCVATIGISGYFLIRGMNPADDVTEPVTGNPTVVLPDSQTNGSNPAGSLDLDPDPVLELTAPVRVVRLLHPIFQLADPQVQGVGVGPVLQRQFG